MVLNLTELAEICNAQLPVEAGDLNITAAANIMTAKAGELTVLSSVKYAKFLAQTQASACLISNSMEIQDAPKNLVFLICNDPEISFLNAVKALHPEAKLKHTISTNSDIDPTAIIDNNVHIGAFSTIAANCNIGSNSKISANVSIGENVSIGKNCYLHPQVVLYANTKIADNVVIHAGVVIGADGFGYKYRQNQHVKVPHVGNVVIESEVEIGANTCIDKAALGSTVIGAGSKIDNLVQIAHNNQLGRNVIVCGQSGISGSCTVGDGVIIAGGVGIADHVTIETQAVVMARSGVSQNVKAGSQVFGIPARERKIAWRELAALSKLPELLKKVKQLEKTINHKP